MHTPLTPSVFVPLAPCEKHAWLRAVMADPTLPATVKVAAWGLVEHHNSATGRCDPAAARLARVCGLSERSVTSAAGILGRRGLVRVTARRQGARQGSNAYALIVAASPQARRLTRCPARKRWRLSPQKRGVVSPQGLRTNLLKNLLKNRKTEIGG